MDNQREQHLLAEIAKRDAIIERMAAENLILKQTIDALTRRIFGAKSEKLDPAQLQLLLEADLTKKPAAAAPADPGPAAEIKTTKSQQPKPAHPASPNTSQSSAKKSSPPKSK